MNAVIIVLCNDFVCGFLGRNGTSQSNVVLIVYFNPYYRIQGNLLIRWKKADVRCNFAIDWPDSLLCHLTERQYMENIQMYYVHWEACVQLSVTSFLFLQSSNLKNLYEATKRKRHRQMGIIYSN